MMAKKKATKRAANRPKTKANGERVTPVTGVPASDYWVATDCTVCRSENTWCYNTSNGKHYFKCNRCGFTWAKKKRIRKSPGKPG